jgi:RNA polymerase sigma-70 factor (ECF subfamily)
MNRVYNAVIVDELRAHPDQTLVDLSRSGMQTAYAELCRRYSTMAFRTAYRITKNSEDAEDCVQESLLRAFAHLESFDGRSGFSTWLTRITINCSLMLLRKRQRHPTVSVDADIDGTFEIPDESLDPEWFATASEEARALLCAVRRLPPHLRCLIEYRYYREKSTSEVVKLTGLTSSAAKTRLSRARSALRRMLTEGKRLSAKG